MALTEYKKKRTLGKTPEPAGGKSLDKQLRFVVQKHDASRLHYDFRLEMGNVLKSWAVPKGPSMNPKDKRLAVMVEDHPYDYRTFEGVIPEGNYGAGRVMVWDEGTYQLAKNSSNNKKTDDTALQEQLRKGKIHIIIDGSKLKGEYALVRSSWQGKKNWLLMKLKDEFATAKDILKEDASVVSGLSMDEIGAAKPKPRRKTAVASKKSRVIKKIASLEKVQEVEKTASVVPSVKSILKSAPATKFTKALSPMLATLVDQPFDDAGWSYEIKWDGYRALAFMKDGFVDLKSRNDKVFNEKFYPVHRALSEWKVDAIVDGEVVVLKETGMSDFGSLQNWRSEADGDLVYYVFDLLWFKGKDLKGKTLAERQAVLKSIIPSGNGVIRLSESFDATGTEMYATAKRMGLEGIIAKKTKSIYSPGLRSNEWLKIKANQRQEVVIGGYTHNLDSVKPFSALLVGVYEGNRFVYTGKIGTGFRELQQHEMLRQFAPYIIEQAPFSEIPDYNKPSRFNPRPTKATVTWLKPVLVCEVSFTEMTSDGVMRHPSFEGMRVDKKASTVTHEVAKHTGNVVAKKKDKKSTKEKSIVAPHAKRERATLLNPSEETQVRAVAGHEIKFTNLSKVYWPKDKITKRDMLNYYYKMAPIILPYLKDRPQSLNRFPNGIDGKTFYQKDVTGKVPEWVETYLYHSSDEPELDKHYLVPKTEADILLMASLGCIELNPWSSTTRKPDHPDWCIIDLDPDKQSFDQVIEAARVTKDVLDTLGIDSYCKTSGSTGIHIYIPLGAKYTYEQSKEFARAIVTIVHEQIPKLTSIERTVGKRGGKMYLDFLQNRPQATLACAYSLRPKPGAPVSMPLHWDEVKKGLKLIDFTINNAYDRVKEVGDIFKPVLGKGINLEKYFKKISK